MAVAWMWARAQVGALVLAAVLWFVGRRRAGAGAEAMGISGVHGGGIVVTSRGAGMAVVSGVVDLARGRRRRHAVMRRAAPRELELGATSAAAGSRAAAGLENAALLRLRRNAVAFCPSRDPGPGVALAELSIEIGTAPDSINGILSRSRRARSDALSGSLGWTFRNAT